jgi:anti-sigma B factor antagonist
MTRQNLVLEHCLQDDRHTIRVAGELDIASVGELARAAVSLVARPIPALVLDLEELAFVDSSGLHGILTVHTLCEQHGCGFALAHVPPQAQSVLEISGLDRVLATCDEEEVLAAGETGRADRTRRFAHGMIRASKLKDQARLKDQAQEQSTRGVLSTSPR